MVKMLALIVMFILVIASGVSSADCNLKELDTKFNYKAQGVKFPIDSTSYGQKFICKDNHAMKGILPEDKFSIDCIVDPKNAKEKIWNLNAPFLKVTKCEPGCAPWTVSTLDQTRDASKYIFDGDTGSNTVQCAPGHHWLGKKEITGVKCNKGKLTSGGKPAECQLNVCNDTAANAASAAAAGVEVPKTHPTSGPFKCKDGYYNNQDKKSTVLNMICTNNVWSAADIGHACITNGSVITTTTLVPCNCTETKAPAADDGLAAWVIVLIVFCVLLFVTVIGLIIFICCYWRKRKDNHDDDMEAKSDEQEEMKKDMKNKKPQVASKPPAKPEKYRIATWTDAMGHEEPDLGREHIDDDYEEAANVENKNGEEKEEKKVEEAKDEKKEEAKTKVEEEKGNATKDEKNKNETKEPENANYKTVEKEDDKKEEE